MICDPDGRGGVGCACDWQYLLHLPPSLLYGLGCMSVVLQSLVVPLFVLHACLSSYV